MQVRVIFIAFHTPCYAEPLFMYIVNLQAITDHVHIEDKDWWRKKQSMNQAQ